MLSIRRQYVICNGVKLVVFGRRCMKWKRLMALKGSNIDNLVKIQQNEV